MFVGQDEAGTRSMKKKGTNTQVRENGTCGGETQINTRGDKITCAVVTECRSKTEGSVAVRRITSTTGKLPFVMGVDDTCNSIAAHVAITAMSQPKGEVGDEMCRQSHFILSLPQPHVSSEA